MQGLIEIPIEPLRTLGEGRSGVVYEVEHPERRGRYALKVFARLGDDALARMKADFDALTKVAHPNLVKLLDFRAESGRARLLMELVSGLDFVHFCRGEAVEEDEREHLFFGQVVQPLGRSAFATMDDEGAFLRLRRALSDVASGLAALHANDRIHGDVRPSNVLVEPNGRALLLDLLSEHAPSSPERFAGTAAYMAPEHGQGMVAGPATDMYSLGVLLFEAITGELPFVGSGREIFIRKNTVSAPRPSLLLPQVPADLDELTFRLLDRRPAARPTADEVVAKLSTSLG